MRLRPKIFILLAFLVLSRISGWREDRSAVCAPAREDARKPVRETASTSTLATMTMLSSYTADTLTIEEKDQNILLPFFAVVHLFVQGDIQSLDSVAAHISEYNLSLLSPDGQELFEGADIGLVETETGAVVAVKLRDGDLIFVAGKPVPIDGFQRRLNEGFTRVPDTLVVMKDYQGMLCLNTARIERKERIDKYLLKLDGFSGAEHDLRIPVGFIYSYPELMREDLGPGFDPETGEMTAEASVSDDTLGRLRAIEEGGYALKDQFELMAHRYRSFLQTERLVHALSMAELVARGAGGLTPEGLMAEFVRDREAIATRLDMTVEDLAYALECYELFNDPDTRASHERAALYAMAQRTGNLERQEALLEAAIKECGAIMDDIVKMTGEIERLVAELPDTVTQHPTWGDAVQVCANNTAALTRRTNYVRGLAIPQENVLDEYFNMVRLSIFQPVCRRVGLTPPPNGKDIEIKMAVYDDAREGEQGARGIRGRRGPVKPITLVAVPQELDIVFGNIVSNAVNVMAEEMRKQQRPSTAGVPTLDIFSGRLADGTLTITVADNGPGIPTAAILAKYLRPHWRRHGAEIPPAVLARHLPEESIAQVLQAVSQVTSYTEIEEVLGPVLAALPPEQTHSLDQLVFEGVTVREGGTGLGLPQVRRTCERMGWSIEAVRLPGRGTAFVVFMPEAALKMARQNLALFLHVLESL